MQNNGFMLKKPVYACWQIFKGNSNSRAREQRNVFYCIVMQTLKLEMF